MELFNTNKNTGGKALNRPTAKVGFLFLILFLLCILSNPASLNEGNVYASLSVEFQSDTTLYLPWFLDLQDDSWQSYVTVQNTADYNNQLTITYISPNQNIPDEVVTYTAGAGKTVAWRPAVYSPAMEGQGAEVPDASFAAGGIKIQAQYPIVGRMVGITPSASSFAMPLQKAESFIPISQDFLDIGEYGTIDNLDHNWQTVQFLREYDEPPIVIAKPISYNGGQPAHVRIKDVTAENFQLRIEEWAYLDGGHAKEEVSFLIVPAGRYNFANGDFIIEAGKSNIDHNWKGINFTQSFPQAPIILTQCQTYNGQDPVVTRNRYINTSGFQVCLQEEEAKDNFHTLETAGYIAITPFNGILSIGGFNLMADIGSISRNHDWGAITFSQDFEKPPAFLADMQTCYGGNTAGLRYRNLDNDSASVFVQEEQSNDDETSHCNENVGYFAFRYVPKDFLGIGEYGTIDSLDHNWQTVKFLREYDQPPVVIAKPLSYNGGQPAHVRVKDITTENFQLRIEEWAYLDGSHAKEEVSFLIVPAGRYNFANGDFVIEAGKSDISHKWKGINFTQNFPQIPILLTQCQTYNDPDPIVTRNRYIKTSGFQVKLQEEEAEDNSHAIEATGYIAITSFNGVLNAGELNLRIDIGFISPKYNWQTISFYQNFENPPAFLADMQTSYGGDTAGLRYHNLDNDSVRVLIQEEQSNDDETSHCNENVGYFAFEPSLELDTTGPDIISFGIIQEITNSLTVNISGQVDMTDGDTQKVTLTGNIQNSPVDITSINPDGTFSGQATLTSGDGTKTITATGYDDLGNPGNPLSDSVELDTQAPVIVITSPADGTHTNQNPITVNYTVDGQPESTQHTFTSQGPETITITETDQAGNTGSASIEVTYDITAPTGTITINNGDEYTENPDVTLTLTATGADYMFIDGDVENAANVRTWIDYAAEATVTLTSGDGTKTVSVQYRDEADNYSDTYSDEIIYTGPSANKFYWAIVDEHDTPLPSQGQYYDYTGGDRGVLNTGDISYTWNEDSDYTATVISTPGSWTWGGMWYSLVGIDTDNIPLDFKAIFGPYVKPEYQGEVTDVEIVINDFSSPSNNTNFELRIECKNINNAVIGSNSWTDLTSGTYPRTFVWSLPESSKGEIEVVTWVIDSAQVGDSISVDKIRLRTRVSETNTNPTEEQAFLWTYSWLMRNYDPVTGMVQDRSNWGVGDQENVSATAKTAKITYYAYTKGYITYEDAVAIITKIADTLINVVPRGPSGINTLWPHFTSNGGTVITPNTEWASGDTAYAALDIVAALQMIGDPQNQIPSIETFLQEIDWEALFLEDGSISLGYNYGGSLEPNGWKWFGMEAVGVNWAYASATGDITVMEPPPSYNGSGFIDNAQYPMVLSGEDGWGNDWDVYRDDMADTQIGWYSTPEHYNQYLSNAGLFGLSAAEVPDIYTNPSVNYEAYGVGGIISHNDGNAEVVTLHYPAMIADIRLTEARQVWELLRDGTASFLQDRIVVSPLNNMESMRVDKNTGECTINYLKGSWNLALQAEGWAMTDSDVRNDLIAAIQNNTFLDRGYNLLKHDTEPPEGTITINHGDEYTNSTQVTLTLSATDNLTNVEKMQITVVGTELPEEDFVTTKIVDLPGGDGGKTVSVIYKDEAGNPSVPASDSITLDTVAPPITGITPQDGSLFEKGDVASFNIEATGGPVSYKIDINGLTERDWGADPTYSWDTSSKPSGLYTITIYVRDEAGNEISQQIELYLAAKPPALPVLL